MQVDYSSYFVTGRELLPPGMDFIQQLDGACKGGVTIVQLREKNASTKEFLELAFAAKAICDKYKIPLLINDRLDVALAVECGLHVGQDDMPAGMARKMLPKGALLGVSVTNANEMKQVLSEKVVDYVGIGPVHATSTKKDHKPALGVRGTRDILALMKDSPIKAVAIGGLNESTIPNLLRQSPAYIVKTGKYRALDGVAYVSVVAASSRPQAAAQGVSSMIRKQPQYPYAQKTTCSSPAEWVDLACKLLSSVQSSGPSVVHSITNQVVMNDSANLTLAYKQSPIMSSEPEEVEDLGKIVGALLLNMGTLGDKQILAATRAGQAANKNDKPVILDPVGVGATAYRQKCIGTLMNSIHMSVVKGNAAEIGTIAGSTEVQARGVDSVGSGFSDPATLVRDFARREKVIVAMTGKTDYVSDGNMVVAIDNGHAMLGDITGSGCMAGISIACFTTVTGVDNAFTAAVSGLLAYNIAAEIAAAQAEDKGPNSFRTALIDTVYHLTPEHIKNRAKLRIL